MSAAATAAGYLYASGRLRGRDEARQQENETSQSNKPKASAPSVRAIEEAGRESRRRRARGATSRCSAAPRERPRSSTARAAGSPKGMRRARSGGLFVGALSAESGVGTLFEALDLFPGARIEVDRPGPEGARSPSIRRCASPAT